MSVCVDCGARGGPLCTACAKVAAVLGHTAEERLRMLGEPIIEGVSA